VYGKHSIQRASHTAGLSDTIKSTWYTAIHYIIPTHERLAAIDLVPTMTCTSCGEPDTLQHRITICKEGLVIWNWTRARLAAIIRVHPKHINEEWTLRPTYQLWLANKQAAITWIIAHLVVYSPPSTETSVAPRLTGLHKTRLVNEIPPYIPEQQDG
jgi:hypothetical protein